MRELSVVPALAVTSTPVHGCRAGQGADARRVSVQVDVLNNRDSGSTGEVTLRVPQGWTAEPARAPFALRAAVSARPTRFTVTIPSIADRDYQIQAVAVADGREYREGYETIEYRDLEARQLYRTAVDRRARRRRARPCPASTSAT